MFKKRTKFFILLICSLSFFVSKAQEKNSNSGWFSLGGRSTVSLFDHDGAGIGTGGQFRIQLSNNVNTDWFADYISINVDNKVRSDYYHIGWSVLFYPLENQQSSPKKIQPYILAGHCFDFNRKTAIGDPSISEKRWGSAVQAGLGTHFNLTDRFDISLNCQYMIHFTKEIENSFEGNQVHFFKSSDATLEGHLLTTVSVNYKLCRLWKK